MKSWVNRSVSIVPILPLWTSFLTAFAVQFGFLKPPYELLCQLQVSFSEIDIKHFSDPLFWLVSPKIIFECCLTTYIDEFTKVVLNYKCSIFCRNFNLFLMSYPKFQFLWQRLNLNFAKHSTVSQRYLLCCVQTLIERPLSNLIN